MFKDLQHSIPYYWFVRKLIRNRKYLMNYFYDKSNWYYFNLDNLLEWENMKRRKWIDQIGERNLENISELCERLTMNLGNELSILAAGSSVYGKPSFKDIDLHLFSKKGIRKEDINLELSGTYEFHRDNKRVNIFNIFYTSGSKIQLVTYKKESYIEDKVKFRRIFSWPYVIVMDNGELRI